MSTTLSKHPTRTTSSKKNTLFTPSTSSKPSFDPTSHRPSLLKSHGPSLSQATGVAHLTDKRNSDLLLFKNNNLNGSSHRKDIKVSIDYYTIQNTKMQTAQQSVVNTTRNIVVNSKMGNQSNKKQNNKSTSKVIVSVNAVAA